MKLIINCDGGSRGNPGPAACAFVVKNDAGEILEKCGKYLGIGTNNEAEYQAVVEAWKWINEEGNEILRQFASQAAQDGSILCCRFFLDSKLVVNQINGVFKVKEPRMQELMLKVREMEGESGVKASYEYVPREKNFEADKLVNETLDRN